MNTCPFFSEKMNLSNSQAALGVRGFPTVGSFTYQYFIGSLFVPLNQSMHRKIYPKTASLVLICWCTIQVEEVDSFVVLKVVLGSLVEPSGEAASVSVYRLL